MVAIRAHPDPRSPPQCPLRRETRRQVPAQCLYPRVLVEIVSTCTRFNTEGTPRRILLHTPGKSLAVESAPARLLHANKTTKCTRQGQGHRRLVRRLVRPRFLPPSGLRSLMHRRENHDRLILQIPLGYSQEKSRANPMSPPRPLPAASSALRPMPSPRAVTRQLPRGGRLWLKRLRSISSSPHAAVACERLQFGPGQTAKRPYKRIRERCWRCSALSSIVRKLQRPGWRIV